MLANKTRIRLSTGGRYAYALFSAANESGVFETVRDDVKRLKAALDENARLRDLLNGRSLTRRKAAAILSEISDLLGFHPLVADLSRILAKNGRFNLIGDVAEKFRALVDDREGVVSVDLEIFKKHPALLNAPLKAIKEKFNGNTYRFNVKENSELLAGFVVHAGGSRVDCSLKGRLDRTRRNLKRV